MTRRDQVLAEARRIAKARSMVLVDVLADMVLQASQGVCHGFVRTPAGREVTIRLKGQHAIDETPGENG